MTKPFEIGAYYFPNYHVDPRNEHMHGTGWTEWEVVRHALPRLAGHQQPKVPAWGHEDEADPQVMARKIDAAADHGLDYWIFDWYWYDDGPFIDRCLEQGFLNAPNNSRLKFCLMWANHDWTNLHPAKLRNPKIVDYPGQVTPETFIKMGDHCIEKLFKHPSYYCIDGAPYFSFYDLTKLINSFGTVAATRAALDDFRARAKAAGLPGLHLNAILWGRTILPGEHTPVDGLKLVTDLGFDSISSYVWVHHVELPNFPETEYNYARDQYFAYWDKMELQQVLPYIPNISMGWDASPRTLPSDKFENVGYPWMAMIANNTPEAFHEALAMARKKLEARGGKGIPTLNINSWNEWTEGSYLEPDTVHKMAYLEAIRDVFGK